MVGINKVGECPKVIATFLNLPHPESYIGHCFRRTSASLLADSGADMHAIMRHGGCRSSSVAAGYVDQSTNNKKRTADNILGHRSSDINMANEEVTANHRPQAPSVVKLPPPIPANIVGPRSSDIDMVNEELTANYRPQAPSVLDLAPPVPVHEWPLNVASSSTAWTKWTKLLWHPASIQMVII